MSAINWYSHQTKTQRKHWDGRGFWSKAHVVAGPYRRRIEGERVRFLCGHETAALTMPVDVGTVLTCRSCLRVAAAEEKP
jgi:hypothetical protein